MKILDSGVSSRPAMVWLVVVGGWRDEAGSILGPAKPIDERSAPAK